MVQAHFCEVDGMQFGVLMCCFGVLFGVLSEVLVTLWAQVSEISGGMQFGVVVQVLWLPFEMLPNAWALSFQIIETIGVLTSNEEWELFCKIDGCDQQGMHFGVLG